MADIGEKIYLASESDAQEILTLADSLITKSGVDNVVNTMQNNVVANVSNRPFTSVKYGSVAGSQIGYTVKVDFTGNGILFLEPSSYTSGTHTMIIDGQTVGFHNGAKCLMFYFNESVSMSSFEYYSGAKYVALFY